MKKFLTICLFVFGVMQLQAENNQEENRPNLGGPDDPNCPNCPYGPEVDPFEEMSDDDYEIEGPSDEDEGIVYDWDEPEFDDFEEDKPEDGSDPE